MGRAPCCDKANVKRGPWSPEEDAKLKEFIEKYGTGGNWIALPQKAGLKRCGKSCRLRWLNYLRPNIKHGDFSDHEDRIICSLYASIGSRWSIIAAQLPGRTDNDIKNYWNTKLKKKLMAMFSTNQQRKFPPFSSTSLQSPPPLQAQSISNLSQFLRDCTSYSSHNKSFSGHESISFSQNLLCNNDNVTLPTNQSFFQMQEGLITPSQYYPLKDNMLMFGSCTDQASCSSSDGSFCSQISTYGNNNSNKDIKQESMSTSCLQGYNISSSNGYEEEEQQQKFMLVDYDHPTWSNNNNNNQKQEAGIFGEFQFEEVKQQLVSSYSNVCNDNNFCFNDENKTREKAMYFY